MKNVLTVLVLVVCLLTAPFQSGASTLSTVQPSCAPPAFDSLPGVFSHPPDPAWEKTMCWQQYENLREYYRDEYNRLKAMCDALPNMADRCQCYADLTALISAIMQNKFADFMDCIGYEG